METTAGRLVLSGRLGWPPDRDKPWCEDPEVLHLSTVEEPLVEYLLDRLEGRRVSVLYWIADHEIDEEEATRIVVTLCTGQVDGEFGAVYSEVTGYLWTDENLKVGGHDLAKELTDARGEEGGPERWLRLEVDIHDERKRR